MKRLYQLACRDRGQVSGNLILTVVVIVLALVGVYFLWKNH